MLELNQGQARRKVLELALREIALASIVVILSLVSGERLMISASLGMVLFVLPNAYFILSAFRSAGAVSANDFIRRFLRGHTGKLVLTFVAFALAFHLYANVHAPTLFIAYMAMWMLHLVFVSSIRWRA